MKKNKIFLVLLLISFCFIACDEYLDVIPDDRQEIKTLENLSELLVSAYSEASYTFVEWKTDNVEAIDGNDQFDQMTENYQFIPVVSDEDQDTPTYFWTKTYNAIAHSNQVLDEIDNVENTDTDFKNAIKGEALITRAYNHFMLAAIFCQHYTSENASGLGIPYITAPETELKVEYDRGTLQETYDLIEKDLLEGLALVSDNYLTGTGKYHLNKAASLAFASRFYLFKEEYQKSIDYANELLGTGIVSLNYLKDMDAVFTGTSSSAIAAQFYDVYDASNLLVVRKETLFETRYYRGYRASPNTFNEVFNMYFQGGTDHRNLRYGYSSGASAQPKYAELFRYTTSTTGYPYYIMPELRSEEVLFNRMESYVHLNMLDNALVDYNSLATTRYSSGGQLSLAEITSAFSGTEQEAMMSFVLFEKRKEFLREGIRWFDIKRHNIAVTHIDITGDEFNLEETDLKKAIQIPKTAISNGIEANPR